MTGSDFASITDNGALCDGKGQLGPREFENVIRRQLVEMLQAKLVLTGSARTQVLRYIILIELLRIPDDTEDSSTSQKCSLSRSLTLGSDGSEGT